MSASLKVVNNSTTSIWYLYVSPSGNSNWGYDQLGGSVIPSGRSFTLTGLSCPASYDLKIEGMGHAPLATHYGVGFTCGSTMTWTLN